MVRQTASVIVMEILGALVLVLMAASALLLLRLSSGPLDLNPFRDDVEHALTDARDGRVVSIGIQGVLVRGGGALVRMRIRPRPQ